MAIKGDLVKGSRGRKPLGIVVMAFYHNDLRYVVVERPTGRLDVYKDNDNLVVVKDPKPSLPLNEQSE